MSDAPGGPTGRSARPPDDQAAGLRRLFGAPPPHWLPVLLTGERSPADGRWLVALASECVAQGSRTLVVDAARAHVAAALGLKVRFDLWHALSGECAPAQACAAAHRNLAVLPAARALQQAGRTQAAPRFEAALRALARPADCVVLVLPSRQAGSLGRLCGSDPLGDVIVMLGSDAADGAAGVHAIQAARSAAQIDAFRLLFQGMDASGAGSLYPRLAARAARETGARVFDAGHVEDEAAIARLVRQVRCRGIPSARRLVGQEGGTVMETAS